MKKVLLFVLAISALSFADYATISTKFQEVEASFIELVNRENQEYAKLLENADNAERELAEKRALRASIEERINRLEAVKDTRFYASDYSSLVKEYRSVVSSLDREIRNLEKSVADFQKIRELKGGN